MKLLSILLYCLLICINSYSQNTFRSEIKVIKEETTSNKLTVEVIGYGFLHLTAEKEAMQDLFKSIFFRGIPGPYSLKPLIGTNEVEIMKFNQIYFNNFFEKKRFLSFVNEKECTKLKRIGSRRKLKCLLSVDIQTLKDDLKTNKIISDYGF
jgi:hypothetical protein